MHSKLALTLAILSSVFLLTRGSPLKEAESSAELNEQPGEVGSMEYVHPFLVIIKGEDEKVPGPLIRQAPTPPTPPTTTTPAPTLGGGAAAGGATGGSAGEATGGAAGSASAGTGK